MAIATIESRYAASQKAVIPHTQDGVAGEPLVVQVQELGKSYGDVQAVKSISFDVVAGKTLTLLGPSGCGKTTTLRCIAGLETPTHGRISIAGRTMFDHASGVSVEPEKRGIGMVFQSYAIWPHMTVGGNVGFPLKIKRLSRTQVRERVARILDLVGLGDLYDRSASQLSGGQQQRVALARALVFEPQLVLFDEPLSNLDANLRDRMRAELQRLQAELNFTAIFVTHDQQEALSLSDQIIVMRNGLVDRLGAPKEVFQNPATPFSARFLGCANNLQGEVVQAAYRPGDSVTVRVSEVMSLAGRWCSEEPARVGTMATVAFRASHLSIGFDDSILASTENTFEGQIASASFLGDRIDYTVSVGGISVHADGPINPSFARGDTVHLVISRDNCHVFPGTES